MERRRAPQVVMIQYRTDRVVPVREDQDPERSLKRREPKAKTRFPVGGRVWRINGEEEQEEERRRSGKTFDRGAASWLCGCGETREERRA
jgi:predicted lysophospholipase L1 biosynthesis ABC-type transport system permease subunit